MDYDQYSPFVLKPRFSERGREQKRKAIFFKQIKVKRLFRDMMTLPSFATADLFPNRERIRSNPNFLVVHVHLQVTNGGCFCIPGNHSPTFVTAQHARVGVIDLALTSRVSYKITRRSISLKESRS
jgi:hypothetical protein